MFKCRHKYGKVDGEYQYCNKCGIAKAVKCVHNYKFIDGYEKSSVIGGHKTGFIRLYECQFCGKPRQEDISV